MNATGWFVECRTGLAAPPMSCSGPNNTTIAQEIAAEGLDSSLTRAYSRSRLDVSNLGWFFVSHLFCGLVSIRIL